MHDSLSVLFSDDFLSSVTNSTYRQAPHIFHACLDLSRLWCEHILQLVSSHLNGAVPLQGYSAGYALRVVGRFAAFGVGMMFMSIQGAAYMGYIDINWKNIANDSMKVRVQCPRTFLDQAVR